jgi:hypothetical protein
LAISEFASFHIHKCTIGAQREFLRLANQARRKCTRSAQVLVHYRRRMIEVQGLLSKLILNRIVLRSRPPRRSICQKPEARRRTKLPGRP